jgi:hypothetical protein
MLSQTRTARRHQAHSSRPVVVNYGLQNCASHESACHIAFAKQIASLLGCEFAGARDPALCTSTALYFVPSDTLLASEAHQLGVKTEQDLFGGVVPAPFVATKAITHHVVDAEAATPPGWSHEFPAQVREVVLRGFSAFSLRDARRAAERLLEAGPLRSKPTRATGSLGQSVVTVRAELDQLFADADETEIRTHGLVFEENLSDPETYSVGQARIGDLEVSYCGTQRVTPNNEQAPVYGGSDLWVVRGGFDALLRLDLNDHVRIAIGQARTFDGAARECFPQMFASRRNYDVAQGRDVQGNWRSGVLEQSWRIGGATGAELAALEAFRDDPSLTAVRAACVEVYGDRDIASADARIYFQGADPSVGPMTKYTTIRDRIWNTGKS